MEIKEALRNVEGWLAGGNPAPQKIEVAITRCCNLKCIFCNARSDDPIDPNELPTEKLLSLINEAADMGVREINLSGGGEPFYKPDKALRVMRTIKERGMRGSITTNGTLLSEGSIREIIQMGWDHIVVSIDGPDPESNDFMRNRPGLFKCVERTLKHFKELKEQLESHSPTLHINMIISNKSHTKIAKMFEFAHGLGIERVNLLPLIDHISSSHVAALDERHLKEFREHAVYAKQVGARLGMGSNLKDLMDGLLIEKQMDTHDIILGGAGLSNHAEDTSLRHKISDRKSGRDKMGLSSDITKIPCYLPWFQIVIHSSGHVKPCIYEEPKSFIRKRSLRDVWENDCYLNDIRESMLKGELHKMCSRCCAPVIGVNREIRELAQSKKNEMTKLGRGP